MPNPRFNYLLLLLLATAALLIFGVFTNVLSDLWGSDIKDGFRQNPWLIAAFALLLGLVIYLLDRQKKAEPAEPEPVDIDQYREAFGKFKDNLLEQYQIRLKTKTANRLPINLTAKPSNFGTSTQRAEAYFKELTIESEDIAAEIGKILETHQRLLIIGDPGAGKTTILLFAAINILSETREPKLPLILNLATWQEGRDFADWYAQSIAQSYGLNPVFVKALLENNAVVPFFDGFDEVKEEYRDDCFQKMAAYFGDQRRRQFIVSSRKKAYAETASDAPVYAEIEVQPLTLEQIKKALSENAVSQAADRALLRAIEQDEWLGKAVETPFYLNTASYLFGKGERTLEDFSFKAEDAEGRQAELVEVFVEEQVPDQLDRKHLHFLADKMSRWYFPVFELLDIQPIWIKPLLKFHLAFACITSLFLGLFYVVISGLTVVFVGSLSDLGRSDVLLTLNQLIVFSFIGGWVVSLFYGPTFKTEDVQIWHWRTLIMNWRQLTASLGILLFSTILYVLLREDSIGESVFLLVFGWIIFPSLFLQIWGSTSNFLLYIPTPYQRFWATFRNNIIGVFIFIVGIALGFIIWLSSENTPYFKFGYNSDALASSMPLILTVFLYPLFNSKFLEHFSLRLILYLEHKLPLRVVTFMDRMSDQLIFEDNRRTVNGKKTRGATWRFRHKILQDYFAKLEIPAK